MHEIEYRLTILAMIDVNRLAAFEALGEQDESNSATVWRIASVDGLHRQVMPRAHVINRGCIEERLKWVEENLNRDWTTVIWMDEVPLSIGKVTRRNWVTSRLCG